ncbi:MAG: type II toxin-antitoxin system RelE/ParE family toxin [Firmicutes bacterium]|nr:type II toxin-antitoxin system RelE/ParE family toxin [Bacillota bacterium]
MKVFLTAQAHRDITAIRTYIAKSSQAVANKVVERLYDSANKLAKNPRIGVALSGKFGIETDLRMRIVSPNLILYKVIDDKIIVTRIIDERRDYLAVLGLAESKDNYD